MEYSILLLFILLFFKYFIFIFSFIPVYLMISRQKLKEQHKNNISEKSNEEKNEVNNSSIIKNSLIRLINGYIRYFVIKVGFIASHTIRNFIYRKVLLVDMAEYAIIYYGSEIRAPYNLKIGKGSIIGDKSILSARNGIEIGENVNFSSNVHIWTEQHDHRDPYFDCNSDDSFKVKIGNRAWLGPNVTILPKVTIGEGAVVGAGSVVTKDVEPFTIVAGLPAKKIGERNKELKYIFEEIPSSFL